MYAPLLFSGCAFSPHSLLTTPALLIRVCSLLSCLGPSSSELIHYLWGLTLLLLLPVLPKLLFSYLTIQSRISRNRKASLPIPSHQQSLLPTHCNAATEEHKRLMWLDKTEKYWRTRVQSLDQEDPLE